MSRFRLKKLLVLETNLDDMNPQWFEPLIDRLLEVGALDVVLIPSIMKKSRPAVILQVLSEAKKQQDLLEVIFQESTTLGVRSYPVHRFELRRETRELKTPYGPIKVKVGRDTTGRVLNSTPEFESCLKLARKKKIALKKIYQLT